MASSKMPLAFGALVAGAVVIDYGVRNTRKAFASSTSAVPGGATTSTGGTPKAFGNFPAAVDPLPGAAASRLDQGIDATGKLFPSPWSGKVVVANATDAGWRGGGYIAVQSHENPNFVYYIAEGITPIVKVGQDVTAGQLLGYPVTNPYNGIVGNVEAGRANPANPSQPFAQVVSNSAQMVEDMYHWLLSLGGPRASSFASAGHA